ncbi:flagellar protein FlgN [Botrimarina sp.]|uniref:flagellar protein FlgN n=1 Tax=Botrimarina sp. TaxID=2795802 RepID=UPI0032F03073
MDPQAPLAPIAPTTPPRSLEGWEEPLAELLAELSETQAELLDVLTRKRDLLAAGDRDGLAAIAPEEERLAERLAVCQRRRLGLLEVAGEQGLPSQNLRELAGALPGGARRTLTPALQAAQSQSRLLRHQSLTNWVLVQRTLLHLSQMIEIVACGGRSAPTYDKKGSSPAGGVLMDRAV